MNIQHRICRVAVVVGIWLFSSLVGQEARSETAPQKRRLAIPTTAVPKGAGRTDAFQCIVSTGPEVPASALALSSDGKTLAVGGYKEVLIWDLADAKLVKRIGGGKISSFVHSLVFLKDEGLLAVGEGLPGRSGAVRIIDVETGKETLSFTEPKDVVYALAVSRDEKLLAAGGADSQVHIWSMDDKKVVGVIKDHSDWVLSVSFSADGKFLATGSADKTSMVWEVGTWKSVLIMQQKGIVRDSVFDSKGLLLAVAVGMSSETGVRIRRKDGGRQTLAAYTGAGVPLDIVWGVKPNSIYVACDDKTVKVYDGTRARFLKTLAGHKDRVYSIAVNSDGSRLASGSADGTVKLWNPIDGKLLATLVHISAGTDDWLVVTEQGYLATSSAQALQWQSSASKTPRDELLKLFDKPDLVRETIAGKKVAPPALP